MNGTGTGTARATDPCLDDIVAGWSGIGSQIDGFGHVGIANVPAVGTRGIVLDMAGYFESDIVKEGTAYNRAEIGGAMTRQGIAWIEEGDVVSTGAGRPVSRRLRRRTRGTPRPGDDRRRGPG